MVDVLLTHTKTLKLVDASSFNAAEVLTRAGKIIRYYGVMDGLLRAQFAYPGITFRSIVSPSEDLGDPTYPLVSICRR